jgi:hypothetical protein
MTLQTLKNAAVGQLQEKERAITIIYYRLEDSITKDNLKNRIGKNMLTSFTNSDAIPLSLCFFDQHSHAIQNPYCSVPASDSESFAEILLECSTSQ